MIRQQEIAKIEGQTRLWAVVGKSAYQTAKRLHRSNIDKLLSRSIR